jgi:hypothetical protein
LDLNPSITELTTAATDGVIALVALACIALLQRYRREARYRVGLWTWVFGLLSFASLLGAIAHGLDLSAAARSWIWRPLFLSLGFVVALFVVGAVFDYKGERLARKSLAPMLGLGLVFFVITEVVSGAFLVFVAYEAAAMLAALGMYTSLAARQQLAGAGIVAAGIALNILAAALQASGSVALTLLVPFDHNGVFHLVQTVAIAVLAGGLVRGMRVKEKPAHSS